MSRLKTPLLSLGASGSLGRSISVRRHKTQHLAQGFTIPTNPKTPEQNANRSTWAAANSTWKTYQRTSEQYQAWTLSTRMDPRTLTIFNHALSNLSRAFADTENPSFMSSIAQGNSLNALCTMTNQLDGTTGNEAGNFEVWAGPTARSLSFKGSAAIVDGQLDTPPLGEAGDVVFVQLVKNGLKRGGIFSVTLRAGFDYHYPCQVDGDPLPDSTGFFHYLDYTQYAVRFMHASGLYYLQYSNVSTLCTITDTINPALAAVTWTKAAATDVLGSEYDPGPGAAGNPIVNFDIDLIMIGFADPPAAGNYMISGGDISYTQYRKLEGDYFVYRVPSTGFFVCASVISDPAPANRWQNWSRNNFHGQYAPVGAMHGYLYAAAFDKIV